MTQETVPAEQPGGHFPQMLEARTVCNFQLIPDSAGFVLVFGTRLLTYPEQPFSTFPEMKVAAFSSAYLSHLMLKDLARVMNKAVSDYEQAVGPIAFPPDAETKKPDEGVNG